MSKKSMRIDAAKNAEHRCTYQDYGTGVRCKAVCKGSLCETHKHCSVDSTGYSAGAGGFLSGGSCVSKRIGNV